MLGLGEAYFVPFALEAGVSVGDSGLLATWPTCIGAACQFLLYRFASGFPNPKRLISILIVLQVLTLLLISFFGIGVQGKSLFYILLAFGSIYWFCTFTVGPIWNIWITQLIPSQETTKFFSDRLGFSQLSLFVSFVVAGVFLESQVGNQKMAFVFIFLGAALARLLSGYCIAKLPLATQGIENPGAELIETKNENQSSLRYFVVFVCMLYVSVWISAPFFTAYMLHFKQFDYYEFVAITGSLVAARFFFASFIHRFLERFGTKRSMILGAFIVLWLPVMWLFSDNVFYLCFVQVVAGIGWGALELGINIFMIQNWREKDRSRVLSWFNLSMAISMTVGSYFGVWILQMYGSDSFSLLFIVSSFARVIPLAVLLFVGIDRLRLRIVSERIVTLRSGSGPASKPILYVENDSVS